MVCHTDNFNAGAQIGLMLSFFFFNIVSHVLTILQYFKIVTQTMEICFKVSLHVWLYFFFLLISFVHNIDVFHNSLCDMMIRAQLFKINGVISSHC